MNSGGRDWLLSCPYVVRISELVRDAHATGLIDLPASLADAVATDLRSLVEAPPLRSGGEDRARRLARHHAHRQSRCRILIAQGTATLVGAIGPGAAVYPSGSLTILHLTTCFPASLVNTFASRRLSEIVSSPTLAIGNYRVLRAEHERDGCAFWFHARRLPLPRDSSLRCSG